MKFKKLLALFFVTFVLFTSCISTQNISYISRSPSWINGVEDSSQYLNYIIVVNSPKKDSLYKDAVNIFVKKFVVNLSLGDKIDEYVNSLIENLSIPEFDVYNTKRYIVEEDDNSYKGYFLFVASKEKVSTFITSRFNLVKSITEEIDKLVNISNDNYRNNRDLISFDNLVDAYILARDYNINYYSNNVDELLNRLLNILDNMTISVADFNPDTLECEINVVRKVGLFPPLIVDSNIKISYSSFNPQNNPYLSVEKINIPSKLKSYKFIPRNTSYYKNGVLLLEIDIDEALARLRKSGYADTASILQKNNKGYVIGYNNSNFFENKKIILNVLENDLNQVPLTPRSVNKIISAIELLGADVKVDYDEIEIDNTYDYQIIIRNEITDKIEGYKAVVRTVGSVVVKDIADNKIIYDSKPFEIVVSGDDMESAINEVFDMFTLKSIFLLKENY